MDEKCCISNKKTSYTIEELKDIDNFCKAMEE